MFFRLLCTKRLSKTKLILLIIATGVGSLFFKRAPFFEHHPRKPSVRETSTPLTVTNALPKDAVIRNAFSSGPSVPTLAKNLSRKPLPRQSTNSKITDSDLAESLISNQAHIFTLADIQKEFGRNVTEQCKKPRLQFEKRTCTRYLEMKFMKNKTERVGLVSFPGSGNTWCRLLLEEMTGYFTGSVYKDKRLLCGGMLGEEIADGSVVAIKTHDVNPWITKMIFLYRNPWHAFVSYHTFQKFRDHTSSFASATNVIIPDKPFEMYYRHWDSIWRSVFRRANNLTIHFLSYESLKTNLEVELVEVVRFLDLEVTKAKLNCLVRHQDLTGTFKRHSTYSFPYSKNQTAMLQTWIDLNRVQLEALDINVTKWVW